MNAALGMLLRIALVEPVDVLDQRHRRATEALRQQIGTRVGSVGGDAPNAGRVLPERKGWIAIEMTPGTRLHKERQQMAKQVWRGSHHPVGREQGPEHVGVAQGIGEHELRQYARRQAEVEADGEGVPAPHAAADANDEPVVARALPQWPRPAGRSSPGRRR